MFFLLRLKSINKKKDTNERATIKHKVTLLNDNGLSD